MKINNHNFSLERAYDIIKRPITTEKSTNLQQFNQYSFIVSKNSNSLEIKNAIEMIFKVKVIKLTPLYYKGKTFKGTYGFRKDTKEQLYIEEGNTIDSSIDKIMLTKFKPTTPGLRGTVLSKKDLSMKDLLKH